MAYVRGQPPPLFLPQLQQETQASRCSLLLVSEDNLQLSCKVRVQVHCGTGPRPPRFWKNLAHPLTGPHHFVL